MSNGIYIYVKIDNTLTIERTLDKKKKKDKQ